MSISSYHRNVSRGVTGAKTMTCFPAALEQISPNHRLVPEAYLAYQRFARNYSLFLKVGENTLFAAMKDTIDVIVRDLGNLSCNSIEFDRIDNSRDFKKAVKGFMRHDYRVAIDVAGNQSGQHTVGLIPIESNSMRIVSNWIPYGLRGEVSLDEIYPFVEDYQHISQSKRHPFAGANITALPPAA